MGRRASASKAGKGAKAGPQPAQLNTELVPAADLQRRLESGNSLPEEEALQVLGHVPAACTNLYDKSCKSQRDNPDCFCGLLPQPEGFRKKGIWQREAQTLAALGRDPADSCRKVCGKMCELCVVPSASPATPHLHICNCTPPRLSAHSSLLCSCKAACGSSSHPPCATLTSKPMP